MPFPFMKHSEVTVSRRGKISRRDLLRCLPGAAVTLASLRWTDLVSAQAAVLRKRGKACILLWMQGGPSQFETFSPLENHPNAGETRPMATSVPGIQIAENLPHLAATMEDLCIIRSVTSKEGSHPRATYLLHTGYLPNPSVQYPAFGANVSHQLAETAAELPGYVSIGRNLGNAVGGGILGVSYNPFVMRDPRQRPDNTMPRTESDRFRRRLQLLGQMDEQFRRRGAIQEADDHQALYARAAEMILSPDMAAFDVQQEPAKVHEAYGDTAFATGCLLARRLVEAGVTFVEVNLGNWDTHQNNFVQSRDLCGQLDQPFAQLVRDLKQRGMLDDTLVICMGEFGRTPRINPRAGRDHYPRAFSVALAGGGVRGGQVIGTVEHDGSAVKDQPVTVPDLFRTFCAALGVDADREHATSLGRPIKIADEGEIVPGILGMA